MSDRTTTQNTSNSLSNLASQMTGSGSISDKLKNASLDPEGTQKLIEAMQPIALGSETDLANNQNYQNMLNTSYAQNQAGLAQGMNNLRSQYSKSGHNLDSALMQGQKQLINENQTNYDSTMADKALSQYNAEKTRQLQAASGLMTTYMTPADLAAKSASTQATTTTSSGWK